LRPHYWKGKRLLSSISTHNKGTITVVTPPPFRSLNLPRPFPPTCRKTHIADGDLQGIIAPVYRGFHLHWLGGEIERLKRAVDAHWSERYLAAGSLAEREAVLMAERGMRFEPKDWIE
jgi:hypothetical protein